MKKIISILLFLLAISGCSKQESTSFHIVCPSGAPALAFYKQIDNLEVLEAGAIKTLLVSNDAQIAVLPSNVGISLIQGGADYSLASTITFGNFYLVSTGKDEDEILDKDDDIVLFQKGGVPDKVFNYLYSEDITSNVQYVNEASDALRELVNENSTAEYVLMAEPALHIGLVKNKNAKVYADLQDLYKQKTGLEMFQASIFVRNDLDNKKVKEFLKQLQIDINELITNPDLLKQEIENTNLSNEEATALFGNVDMSIASIKDNNGVGLDYKDGLENAKGINEFVKILGVNNESEDIFFK